MKNINIEPIARVEGHGGIRVELEKGTIKKITVDIYEGPRLIEQLVVGKTPEEDVSITSRICAICFVSHRFAAIKGLEKCLGINPSRKTKLLRKLAHYGEIIESNALHYYLLALPDLVGFPDAISMISKFPDDVVGGLELKKFGNRVMEIIAGRRVHGENMRIGGFGSIPTDNDLLWVKKRAMELIPLIESGIELWKKLSIPDFMEEDTIFSCLNPEDGKYGFDGENILISDRNELSVEDYKKLTNERVVEHSFAKRCRYKGKPYTVGAIARMINLGERLEGISRDYYEKFFNEKKWRKNPLYNNIAQAIEILFCLENIPYLIDKIMKSDYKETEATREDGTGTGGIEAPRGTLFHHYSIEKGLVKDADFVAPTTQNLDEMEKYLWKGGKNLLEKGEKDIELPLEVIVRAFDPCISCSAHMVKVVKN